MRKKRAASMPNTSWKKSEKSRKRKIMESKNRLFEEDCKTINKKLLVFAITFLVNPCVNVFDYLPDFVGYFIIAFSLTYFAKRAPHFEEARTAFFRLACVSIAKIPSYLFMIMIRGQNTIDNDIRSLFTLSLTAIETLLLIVAITQLFNGISYLGQRGNALSLIRRFPISKSGKRTMSPDGLRNFCYFFAIYKFAFTAFPEMLLLTKTVDAGSYSKVFNVARLYPYTIILAVVSVFVLGIILTRRFSKFLRAINEEGLVYSSVDLLLDDLSREAVEKKLKIDKIKTTLTLFLIATFFTVDINVDNLFGIDAVPNFIFGIFILLASIRLNSLIEDTRAITVLATFYSVVALIAYYFQIKFMTEYGYELLTASFAKDAYMSVIISAGAEFVLYVSLVLVSALTLAKLALRHTGLEKSNPHYSKVDQDYHKRIVRDVWIWFGCGFLAGAAKLADVILRYFSSNKLVAVETESGFFIESDFGVVTSSLVPWFGLVVFGTTALFILFSLYLFGKLKDEVTLKYS